ncbi:MAG: HDOD domain-containing protein [Spirochaetia bacterium]
MKYINDLPVLPEVATKVINLAEDGLDISFKELENIIKIDPGLTSKILKIANSALYARQKEIESLQKAITLLGFKNIKSLVLLVIAARFFQKAENVDFYRGFWRHSIITAFMAKTIMIKSNKIEISELSFICGLLHNIGQAMLFNVDPQKYSQVMEKSSQNNNWIEVYEEELFGVNHRQLGAELFKKWNFPETFIDVVLEHDSLNITSQYKNLIIIITLSDLITDKLGFGVFFPAKSELLDTLLLHTALSKKDIEYYEKYFLENLKKDPLFHECRELFGLGPEFLDKTVD